MALRITYCSPNVMHRMCYTHQELIGHDISDLCHPDDRARVGREMTAAITSETHQVLSQHRNITARGETGAYVACLQHSVKACSHIQCSLV